MKRWSWLLLAVMLVAGCAGGKSSDPPIVPVPTPPEAEGPLLVERSLYRQAVGTPELLPGATEVFLSPGDREAAVAGGEALFTWRFDRSIEGWEDRVRTEGAVPVAVTAVGQYLQARFDAAAPARWSTWVEGVAGSEVDLVRHPQPSVRIGYRRSDEPLVMLASDELVLPAGAFTLELRFDQPMWPDSLEIVRENNQRARFEATWVAADHLVMRFSEVPALLPLRFEAFRAAGTTLPLMPRPLMLSRSDVAPYLERYHLVTGESQRVAAIPTNMLEAKISPDKRWIALRSWVRRSASGPWMWPVQITLIDLQTGQAHQAPLDAVRWGWLRDGTLIALGEETWGQEPGWFTWHPLRGGEPTLYAAAGPFRSVSPDGRLTALLADGPEPAQPDPSLPSWQALQLLDPATGREEVIPSFIRGWYFGKGGPWYLNLAWSPDGSRVAALDPAERFRPDLIIYDLRTGERQVVRQGLALYPWGAELAWSPAGDRLLVSAFGAIQIIPLDGGPIIEVGEGQRPPALWDERGERILSMSQDWRELFVYEVARSDRTELGDGWPVGWDGDWVYLIRWGASDARYILQGE